MIESGLIVYDRPNTHHFSSKQLFQTMVKVQSNKNKIIKQLEQINVPVADMENLSLPQLYIRYQKQLQNTYSIKYLGLKQNEIGIISKRIDPVKENMDMKMVDVPISSYAINKYFYPKPLKVPKRLNLQPKLNHNNLQQSIKSSFQNNNNKKQYRPLTCLVGKLKNAQKKRNDKNIQIADYLAVSRLKQQNNEDERSRVLVNKQQTITTINSYSRCLGRGLLKKDKKSATNSKIFRF